MHGKISGQYARNVPELCGALGWAANVSIAAGKRAKGIALLLFAADRRRAMDVSGIVAVTLSLMDLRP